MSMYSLYTTTMHKCLSVYSKPQSASVNTADHKRMFLFQRRIEVCERLTCDLRDTVICEIFFESEKEICFFYFFYFHSYYSRYLSDMSIFDEYVLLLYWDAPNGCMYILKCQNLMNGQSMILPRVRATHPHPTPEYSIYIHMHLTHPLCIDVTMTKVDNWINHAFYIHCFQPFDKLQIFSRRYQGVITL